jgi:hypothetical protein
MSQSLYPALPKTGGQARRETVGRLLSDSR